MNKDNQQSDISEKDREEAIDRIEKSLEKNNEDQTKQVTTIGWAGMMFLVSMNAEKIVDLSVYGKVGAIASVVLFNLALFLEYATCFASIKSSEKLGINELELGKKWYHWTRKIRLSRDIIFSLALLALMTTLTLIISQNMGKENNNKRIDESHVNSPSIVNMVMKPQQVKANNNEVRVEFSNPPSFRTINVLCTNNQSKNVKKESDKK